MPNDTTVQNAIEELRALADEVSDLVEPPSPGQPPPRDCALAMALELVIRATIAALEALDQRGR